MRARALIMGLMLLMSVFVLIPAETRMVKAENPPMVISDTAYTISDDLTIDDRDLIIENSTVYIYGTIYVYEHNVTIKNSTLLWNPTYSYQYALKCYNRYDDWFTTVYIENTTMLSNTSYRYYGIWAEGRYQNLYIYNTLMNGYYSVTAYTLNNLIIDGFKVGEDGPRYITVSHQSYQKSIFGEAIIRNTHGYRLAFTLDGLSTVLVENTTTTYYTVNDWGTVVARNLTFSNLDQVKGQTYIYQYLTLYVYDMDGQPINANIIVTDGDGNQTLEILNGSGSTYVHTYNIYEANDVRFLNLTIGDGQTQFRIVPDYKVGYFEARIYMSDNGTIYNISVPHLVSADSDYNVTGAVTITPDQETIDYFTLLWKIVIGINGLILLGVGMLVYVLVIRRRRR